jgi:hypothetical protein
MTYWLDFKDSKGNEIKPEKKPVKVSMLNSCACMMGSQAEIIDPLLLKDIYYFHATYPQYISPLEASEAFNKKYPGYLHDHSLDYVLKAFKIVMK